MADIEITGLDELIQDLSDLQENASSIFGEHSIQEILTPNFMKANSQFCSIDEFLSVDKFEQYDDFESIPDDELDAYVSQNTKFSSWDQMLDAAIDEFADTHLGI